MQWQTQHDPLVSQIVAVCGVLLQVVKQAEAEAEAKYLSGVGVARQRQVRTSCLMQPVWQD